MCCSTYDLHRRNSTRTSTGGLFQHGIGKYEKWPVCTSSRLVMYNQQARERAGVVQWQYRSFPSFGRGFDSHRPLHKSRSFNCPYTANLPESSFKMDRFGPQMDPTGFNWTPTICRGNRPVGKKRNPT